MRALHQVAQDGARQGGAFLRVGAGAQFIQHHQCAAVGHAQDAHDVGDVPGKGGKGLFDGLFVADIGEDL